MLASEFIKVIEKAIIEHGDLPIMTENPCSGEIFIPYRLRVSNSNYEDICNVIDQITCDDNQKSQSKTNSFFKKEITKDDYYGIVQRDNIKAGTKFFRL